MFWSFWAANGRAHLLLIGIFLKSAAENGYAQALSKEILDGVGVSDLMTRSPICIPAHLPLNFAVDDYFLTHHHVAYPVTEEDGRFRCCPAGRNF